MSAETHFTDEDLTAFLDGEASAALNDRIASALEHDAALQQRLDDLSFPLDDLKLAMQGVADQAPELLEILNEEIPHEEVLREENTTDRSPSRLTFVGSLAASVVISLAVGGFLGKSYFTQPTVQAPTVQVAQTEKATIQGWKGYVAAYQSLYVQETLTSGTQTPGQTAEQNAANLKELSEVMGIDLAKVTADPELEFKRAQLLGFKGKPLVQLAYLSPTGEPVALCIVRVDNPKPGELSMAELEGMASASWRKDGFGFLFIGGQDSEVIRTGAERFKALL